MIKFFVSAVMVLATCVAAAPPAGAAECGLLALLSPCSVPLPTPPAPVTPLVPLPVVEPLPAPLPVPAPAPAPAPTTPSAQRLALPEAADRIFQLVNQERAASGLPVLTASPRLGSIAAGHSMAMAERRSIWHNDAYMAMANRRALGATALGENVATNGTIDDAHRRLMASPGHRANVLRPGFDAVGMAVVRDETGMLYVTQNFADWPGEPGAVAAARPVVAKPTPRSTAANPVSRPPAPAVVVRTAAVAPASAAEPARTEAVAAPVVSSPVTGTAAEVIAASRRAPSVPDATTGAAMVVLSALAALALLGGVGVAVARVGAKAVTSR